MMLDISTLDLEFFGNPLSRWAAAGLVTFAVFTVLAGLKWVVMVRMRRAAEAEPAGWRATLRAFAGRVSILFIAVVALSAGALLLDMPEETAAGLSRVVSIALLLQAALIADELIALYAERFAARQDELANSIRNAISLIRFLARTAIWSLAALMILDNLGLDITTLVAGLGIGGIAIALAAQNILGDLFASLAIILDKPFVVGDFIVFGDDSGTVERIGVKTTRLKSLSGEQLVVPNADLLSTRVRNMRRMAERRIVFTLGVVYETPHATLERIPAMLKEIIDGEELARFDRAHFASYGDFSLNFEIVYFVLSPQYADFMDVQQSINLKIFKRFEDEGIAFAYPTRTVFMAQGEQPAVSGSAG